MRTTNWYDNPLYYDIIFDQDTGVEADFLETVARRHGRRRGAWRILEPACGSGRLLREFSRRGHTVHGFDANPSMLAYAAGRQDPGKPRARLWRDRMEAFTVPRGRGYDLAHCLVSTFKYLLTEEQAAAHLQQVASVLVPGGLYVIGLHLTDYTCPAIQHERWVGRRGRTQVVCNTRTWPAHRRRRLEALRTRLRITRPGTEHTVETHWRFRTYDARQLTSLIRKVPAFRQVACHDFSYDPDSERGLDDCYSDLILVLQRNDT